MAVETYVQPLSGTPVKFFIDDVESATKVMAEAAAQFAPHEQATPNMTVALDAGRVFADSTNKVTEVAAQSTAAITAPATNPRSDVIYIDRVTGAVGVATGTEAASPVDPAIPDDKAPVARINLTTSTSTITNADLDDLRVAGVGIPGGFGTMAKQDADNVAITGGTITGITDLAVADGGTGASTAADARTNLGAAASGANNDITSLDGVTSINSGPLAGFRNAIINGAFDIWQRGTSAAETSAAYQYKWNDRFAGHSDGANLTRARSTDVPSGETFEYSLQITGAASATHSYVVYRIEAADAKRLAHLSAMEFSFWLKLTLGAAPVAPDVNVFTADAEDNFSASTYRTNMTFFATSDDTWTRLSETINPSSLTNWDNGVEFRLILNGSNALSSGTKIARTTGWQLEPGSVATEFERRPIGTELALCQRYYEKSYDPSVTPGTITFVGAVGANATSPSDVAGTRWKVSKRSTPTVVVYSTSTGNSGDVRKTSNNAAVTSVTPLHIGTEGFMTVNKTSAFTEGNGYDYHYTADAEL